METMNQKQPEFAVICSENGDVIERLESIEEAEDCLDKFEAMDRRDGSYTHDFYEVAKWDGDEYVTFEQ